MIFFVFCECIHARSTLQHTPNTQTTIRSLATYNAPLRSLHFAQTAAVLPKKHRKCLDFRFLVPPVFGPGHTTQIHEFLVFFSILIVIASAAERISTWISIHGGWRARLAKIRGRAPVALFLYCSKTWFLICVFAFFWSFLVHSVPMLVPTILHNLSVACCALRVACCALRRLRVARCAVWRKSAPISPPAACTKQFSYK